MAGGEYDQDALDARARHGADPALEEGAASDLHIGCSTSGKNQNPLLNGVLSHALPFNIIVVEKRSAL